MACDKSDSFLLPYLPGEPIDLAHCFECGQIFRWRRSGTAWVGALRGTALALRSGSDGIAVETAGDAIGAAEVRRFLGLEDPLAEIVPRLDTDPTIHACLAALPGMRILRQDPWECLISYICSAWNNIPKITRSTELMARWWGRPHVLGEEERGVEVYSFPSPESLAGASEEELRACGLGYRAPYVARTSRIVAAGELEPATLIGRGYDEALTKLLGLPGIGRKVADCILLFSLEKGEAFPVDVWVRRLLTEYYGEAFARDGDDTDRRGAGERSGVEGGVGEGVALWSNKGTTLPNREYAAIQRFAWQRWGRWAGYAQQYLFYGKRLGVI